MKQKFNLDYVIVAMIVFFITLLCAVTSKAEVVRSGNQFSIEQVSNQDTLTSYTWKDKDGTIYPIYLSQKNRCYIKRISKKSGKEYKYYLPKEIENQILIEFGIKTQNLNARETSSSN